MLNKPVVMGQTWNYASQQQGRETGHVCVVLFEGHFLRWSEQIFLLQWKRDDLLHFSSAEPGSWYQPQRRKRRKRKKLLYMAYCDSRATGICLSIIWCPIAGRAALPQRDPNLVGWLWQPVRLARARLWQSTLKRDAEPSCLCFLGTSEPGVPRAHRGQQDVSADLLHAL